MNNTITTLYFLVKDNAVLICENNVKDFWEQLPAPIAGVKSYDYFYRQFKAAKPSKKFPLNYNKEYFLQKINY